MLGFGTPNPLLLAARAGKDLSWQRQEQADQPSSMLQGGKCRKFSVTKPAYPYRAKGERKSVSVRDDHRNLHLPVSALCHVKGLEQVPKCKPHKG